MDTNRKLDESERGQMRSLWQAYLVRHLLSIPELEDRTILRDLYVASMGEHERTAWFAMHRWWEARQILDPDIAAEEMPFKSTPNTGVPLRLQCGRIVMLQLDDEEMEEHRWPLWWQPAPTEPVWAYQTLGGERYAQLIEWINLTIPITRRVVTTTKALHEVESMANTVGQLYRMAPELVRYTFPSTQKALESQQRRSPLPGKWMKVDRQALHDAVNHIALCMLLPSENASEYSIDGYLENRAWAFAKNDFNLIGYFARPSEEVHAHWLTYKPEHLPLT